MAEVIAGYVDVQAADVDVLPVVAHRHVVRFEKYETCKICGVRYPRSEMTRFRGAWWCHEEGDADDIRGIVLKENESKNRPRNRKESDQSWY